MRRRKETGYRLIELGVMDIDRMVIVGGGRERNIADLGTSWGRGNALSSERARSVRLTATKRHVPWSLRWGMIADPLVSLADSHA